jgi:hypothetical protein
MASTMSDMIAAADGKTEVTIQKLKLRLRLKHSLKTLRRAFWAHGVRYRPSMDTQWTVNGRSMATTMDTTYLRRIRTCTL